MSQLAFHRGFSAGHTRYRRVYEKLRVREHTGDHGRQRQRTAIDHADATAEWGLREREHIRTF
jgi:hypothetical protein